MRKLSLILLGLMMGAVTPAYAAPTDFDLQAHRGGLGLTSESTLAAFEKALRLGVSTLELDVQITRDQQAVVTHDRVVQASKCRDTTPVEPGDPQWPYVGSYVKDLTLAQVRTLDCGSLRDPKYPEQELVPGARMPLLSEVFGLVNRFRAKDVKLNVESKVEAGAPHETAPREQFVQVINREILAARIARQITIQSFDWGTLMRWAEVNPRLPLVALDNEQFLQVGQPGASPWLGGIDIDDFGGDPVAAIASFGADAWSPVQGNPQNGRVGDGSFEPYLTRADVARAHKVGLKVIPWTVNDRATMSYFIDIGVDGMITDRPDALREVMAERGRVLPREQRTRSRVVAPQPKAHAHNDYLHPGPLRDALAQGFMSIEADVWLEDGELRVAHELDETEPGVTLESLYLKPLAQLAADGEVLRGQPGSIQLLIDIKSEGVSTYAAISEQLEAYRAMLTRFSPTRQPGAVEVVISGNRPLPQMIAQSPRYAGYDGRVTDLAAGALPAEVMPLVSDNWATNFTWTGEGPMPAVEQQRLQDMVARARERGYRLRFWNTPDQPGLARTTLWSVLLDAGVDHLNTDDLSGLAAFLRARDVELGV